MKAKIGDYVRLKKPFIWQYGKWIELGKIKEILDKRMDDYNGRYLIECSDVGLYIDRTDFILLTEDEAMAWLI